MSNNHFDSINTPKSEKTKAQRDLVKRSILETIDEETNHTPIKKIPKKKAFTFQVESADAKRSWLHEKAAESIIPTEEAAKVIPDRLFKGLDPLIVHMCVPCKKFNSARDTVEIENGMVQIPLALCTVCRAHLIAQKNMKFYQHDCPSLKKMLNL